MNGVAQPTSCKFNRFAVRAVAFVCTHTHRAYLHPLQTLTDLKTKKKKTFKGARSLAY